MLPSYLSSSYRGDGDDGVATYQGSIRPICARISQLSNLPIEQYRGQDGRYDKAAMVRDLSTNREAIRHELTLLEQRETPGELEDEKRRLDSVSDRYLNALLLNMRTVDARLPTRPSQQQVEAVFTAVRTESLGVATEASQAMLDLAGGSCAVQ